MDTTKLTIAEMRTMLDTKKITAVELAQAHLDAIKLRDSELHAYLEVFADVLEQAKAAAEVKKAEAEANQLLSQSLTPTLLQYQYILKLAPGVQTIFVPSGNQFILPLPDTTTTTP